MAHNIQSVSELNHAESDVYDANEMTEEPIRGFDYLKHFSYMYELNKKYTEHLDMYKLN
ncbi:hypothetical protein Smp_159240 [Schistosoma mansoni]|uniref:hypothetical protein n=1 Tax=Schistosoma mansoni TaxID=6183 RepID=UPI00019B34F0|nr:hypothetical protein Smp_159240 [Schistosoma mansoni]|eukprot:XP_018652752.1 hypothetical protein Smp_159240 [Schistosoma mansoni]